MIALAGNKADKDTREVTFEEAQEYAQANQVLLYTDTSALSGQGVQELFRAVAEALPEVTEVQSVVEEPLLRTQTQDGGCC